MSGDGGGQSVGQAGVGVGPGDAGFGADGVGVNIKDQGFDGQGCGDHADNPDRVGDAGRDFVLAEREAGGVKDGILAGCVVKQAVVVEIPFVDWGTDYGAIDDALQSEDLVLNDVGRRAYAK